MKLDELNNKNYAAKALKENFSMDIDVSSLTLPKARNMLNKVNKLVMEAKSSTSFHKSHHNPSYLKLMFLEEALTSHIKDFRTSRIVLENEEVEKSQVILAAQDMVDSIQKMYEDVNDMLVKELPALVDSIQSEIGANESTQFNQTASEALTALNAMMQETKTNLQNALNTITGQGSLDAFAGDDLSGDVEADAEAELNMEPEMGDETMTPELPDLPEVPEEPEEELASTVGRARR